jgi:hypothetical protein
MKIVDFDGTVLDATFSIPPAEGDRLSIVYESSGGRAGGPNPRNLEYVRGLNVLLRRLQVLGAVVDEIRVESERTRLLPVDQQRVQIAGRSFPLPLASLGDIEDLRREISRHGRKVGQSPEMAVQSGGSSRRLRIFVSGISLDSETLERRVAGHGADAESEAVEAIVEIAAGRRRGGGQGFLVSQAMRRAVERYAVACGLSSAAAGVEIRSEYVKAVQPSHRLELGHGARDGHALQLYQRGSVGENRRPPLPPGVESREVAHPGRATRAVRVYLLPRPLRHPADETVVVTGHGRDVELAVAERGHHGGQLAG